MFINRSVIFFPRRVQTRAAVSSIQYMLQIKVMNYISALGTLDALRPMVKKVKMKINFIIMYIYRCAFLGLTAGRSVGGGTKK
jgi:hypothetical protein